MGYEITTRGFKMAYTNENQIGEVTDVTGAAIVIRTDGSQETVTLGTEIFQGDIIETSDAAAVNIGFIDDSSFAVSNDARIAIDEFVFDPETEGGVQDFSVMKGVFMYTSGLIGRENPDQVEIETPVGSIGIRGTIIGGHINPEGESQVSVIEGAIVVRNDAGEQLLTNQYETVTLSSREIAPSDVQQMDVSRIANDYGAVKDVSSSLFSSFNDQMAQENAPKPDAVNNAEEKTVDAAEEEVKEKADVEAESGEEEVILEDSMPKAETLEEKQLEIKALDDAPELKTINLHDGDKPKPLKGRLGALRDRLINNETQNELDDTVIQTQAQPTISFISGGSIDENSNGGTNPVVGTVALSNATNVTYSLIGPNAADYMLDSMTGLLTYIGPDSGDFEDNDVLSVGIRATDLDTNNIVNQNLQITLNDVNEMPTTRIGLEDLYDVGSLGTASDDVGVLALNGSLANGTRIGRLAVNDPEDTTITVSDFTIVGPPLPGGGGELVSTYFHVVEQGGNFYLELMSGFQMVDRGSHKTISDGTSDIAGITITAPTISFGVEISDGSLNYIAPITLQIADVTNVTGTTVFDTSTAHDVIIGDMSDNNIRLFNSDFHFINGGEGRDGLYLNGNVGAYQYDFTSNSGFNGDLSSIEQIYFIAGDTDDTLRIDIDNIIRLLATSDQNYAGNGELVISTNSAGANVNGVNIVQNDGVTATDLTSNGFVHNGTETRGSFGDYEIYHHNVHGTVAIEATISNAGGL